VSTNQEAIERAKAEFLRAKQGLARALATTPDDRLNWSPSPTARTPVELVGHAAGAIRSLHETLDGRTPQFGGPAEADRYFREIDKHFTSREQVLGMLEENSAAYIAWLDALTPERLNSMVELPFGFGQIPVAIGITLVPGHTNGHTAQLEYIQTIYGDRDWHV